MAERKKAAAGQPFVLGQSWSAASLGRSLLTFCRFELFQRLAELGQGGFETGAAGALFIDDLLGRIGDELLVVQLLVDLLDLSRQFLDFLLQPRAFLVEVDNIRDRQDQGSFV